jgi:hypothetical protein
MSLPGGRTIAATTDPKSLVMERFYQAYDRAFIIASEKEELQGFQDCLALNAGPEYERLSKQLCPFREITLTLSDTERGDIIGGASLAAFSMSNKGAPCVTASLSYIFIEKPYRGRGEFRCFLDAIIKLIPSLFETDNNGNLAPVLVFLEQNDPLEMSAEDYALDSSYTGLDQYDRLRIWQAQGARLLRMQYVQPALTPDQEPTSGLLFGVLRPETTKLNTCLLKAHLQAFFTISVLKGRNPMDDPIAGPQIARLEMLCAQGATIDLLDPGPVLSAIANDVEVPETGFFLDLLIQQAEGCKVCE